MSLPIQEKSNNDSEAPIASLADIDLSSLLDTPGQNLALFDSNNSAAREGEQYLVFQIDEKFYGVSSRNVSEVINPIPVTPLPNVPAWLMGISNLRGNIIPVVNLRKFWKRKSAFSGRPKLIVFRPEENDSLVAFTVDKLHEMITLSEKEINFSAADYVDSFPAFFGKADFNSQTIYLLDADNLLNSVKLDSKPA
jgi:purine-binding chemotaxis protein CheW